MKKNGLVLRLEYQAFVVLFNDILGTLFLCPEHYPAEKKPALAIFSSLISSNPSFTSENVLNLLRARLSKHLIGTMSDEIRKKLVERFYEYSCTPISFRDEAIDIWAFLDCVLDDSFLELQTAAASPFCDPNAKLIATIATRSRLLNKLELDFSFFEERDEYVPLEKVESMILSLSSLKHLSSLSLFRLNDHYISILKLVGKSCPSLSYLAIILETKGIEDEDVVALIMGEKVDQLPSVQIDDIGLQRVLVPIEIRTPLCFSLRHLIFKHKNHGAQHKLSNSAITFVLRHFPFLLKLDVSAGEAIKIHHNTRILVENINFTLGYLSLTSLYGVEIRDTPMLQIVGSVCPFLEDVGFTEGPCCHSCSAKSEVEIESILKNWPQLKTISLYKVKPNCVKLILSAFGLTLLHLSFDYCLLINLADLISCPGLETLRISAISGHSLLQQNPPPAITPFLPQLKMIKSEICLGPYWSRIFEEKSTLTRISLHCCHIGTTMSSHPDWSKVPRMWTRLESLSVHQCTGLTMPMLRDVILPRMPRLKNISIPGRIRFDEKDKQFALDMVDKYSSSFAPVQKRFEKMFKRDGGYQCPILKQHEDTIPNRPPDVDVQQPEEGSQQPEEGSQQPEEGSQQPEEGSQQEQQQQRRKYRYPYCLPDDFCGFDEIRDPCQND